MSGCHDEASFESVIEAHLLEEGYLSISKSDFDFERALFSEPTLAFAGHRTNGKAPAVNPDKIFALLVSDLQETLFIERMEQNEDIFSRFMNERDFQNLVSEWISRKVYSRFRADGVVKA